MRKVGAYGLNVGLLALAVSCGGTSEPGSDEESGATGAMSGSGASSGKGTGAASGAGATSGGTGGGGTAGTSGAGATTGGTGGAGTGGAGTGGGGTGGAGTGGAGTGGDRTCGGPIPPIGGGSSSPTSYEQVQCYVSDPTEGAPDCMSPDDPDLVQKVGDYIQTSGFAVIFVIDAAEAVPLPPACEPLVECCESLAEGAGQTLCYDWLDDPSGETTLDYGCSDSSRFEESFQCTFPTGAGGAGAGEGGAAGSARAGEAGASGASEAGAAGASDGPVRYRCCYNTCGYRLSI